MDTSLRDEAPPPRDPGLFSPTPRNFTSSRDFEGKSMINKILSVVPLRLLYVLSHLGTSREVVTVYMSGAKYSLAITPKCLFVSRINLRQTFAVKVCESNLIINPVNPAQLVNLYIVIT